MRIYQNYHRHSHYTNPKISDSTVTNEDYAKRAVDFGHGIISTMEHGYQGRYIEGYNLAQKYNLKFVFGSEAYWVRDRYDKDRSNCHIYLGARNEHGRQAINDILSEANLTGFYGQARVDVPLILSLPPEDVIVTTACLQYWKYEDVDEITKAFLEHFGKNLFLEVQYHDTDAQKDINSHILQLHNDLKIPLIMGCDSHYIFPEQAQNRTDFLISKGIEYPEETGWFLDYPDGDTAYERFAKQCVLNGSDIVDAMDNTNVFLDVEEYDSPIFNKDIKMPTLYPDWTQEQRDEEYKRIIWENWNEYKKSVPVDQYAHYEEEIEKEVQTVVDTHMADYFLDNYYIIKQGKLNGGQLTYSGRGSAVSFFTNKLLGFTEVDRIAASVKMYPERFMSTTRILQSKSLPDIDMNSASQDPFALAQQQVLGEDHSYPMISYNTMKASAAWKLYAKSQGVPFETANIVSDQIRKYEMAVKHAPEEEADTIDVKDYISREYWDIYDKSADYLGLISSWSISPCSYLLYQGSIRKEIGLIQIKDHLCCLMDGHWAEENHFLKNDQLKVSVWDLIYRVYGKIGLQPHSVSELLAMCPSDDKVWDIYKKGCTLGINQVEQSGTSARVAMYHPTNISELCAFVAAIRPGFKSMYKIFESREPFKYGVKAFDELIQTKEMPNSFVLYQEMEMAALNYAGIPMDECYTAIKNIAKKRVEKVLAYKEQFINGFTEAIIRDEHKTQEEAIKLSEQLWQIIEDSSRYSFNACLAESVVLDKAGLRNGLFNPSVGEMYKICTDINYAKATHHYDLHKKYRRYGYGNALSMYPDGCVRKNNIVGIYPSGKRQCYLVTTQNGHQIECTDNHKFPTPDGYKKLSELKVNDLLYVKGRYEKCKKTYPYTDGNFELNVPKQGERGFQRKPDGASVKYQASRLEHIANCDSCARCGQEYFGDIRFELHHHDFNRTNNDESNLEWLCVSCHKKAHYEHGRTKVFERGSPAQIDVIVSITPTTIQETYDVEMQDPAHTVISESGLVASNSHSYCVALDSLYGAWLKTYHPLEFYEALLQVYEDKGDKDKMALAKEEAKDYFGINFPPYRFGQDNRQIVADSAHNAINNSLTAIKGYGSDVAVLLYECSQMGFTDLVDVLKWLDEHSIKSAKTKPLARIDYFQSFGTIREVLEIIDLFDFLKQGNAKTIKKELVPPYLIPLMERFMNGTNAKGVELKSYTITDMNGLLHEITSFVKSRNLGDISIKVRIQNCIDVLGTPDIATGKPEDRRKLIITAVAPLLSATTGRPWAYKVGAQSLGTGKTSKLTVRASLFSQNALNTGDVIYAKDVSKNDKGFWYLNLYTRIE